MNSPHRRHLPFPPFLCGIAGLINFLALLWILGGGKLFLFISRTQGFWFDGFYGVFTGIVIILAIFPTFFSRRTLSLTLSDMMVFLGFMLSLLIPVMLSEKINASDSDAVRKLFMLLPYAFVPGLWGSIVTKIRLGRLFSQPKILPFRFIQREIKCL